MRVVMVSEEQLDAEFDRVLRELEVMALRDRADGEARVTFRAVNYHLHLLKDKLKKGAL